MNPFQKSSGRQGHGAAAGGSSFDEAGNSGWAEGSGSVAYGSAADEGAVAKRQNSVPPGCASRCGKGAEGANHSVRTHDEGAVVLESLLTDKAVTTFHGLGLAFQNSEGTI